MNQCYICKEDNKEELLLKQCSCKNYYYHQKCLLEWYFHTNIKKNKSHCEVCNKESPDLKQLYKLYCDTTSRRIILIALITWIVLVIISTLLFYSILKEQLKMGYVVLIVTGLVNIIVGFLLCAIMSCYVSIDSSNLLYLISINKILLAFFQCWGMFVIYLVEYVIN